MAYHSSAVRGCWLVAGTLAPKTSPFYWTGKEKRCVNFCRIIDNSENNSYNNIGTLVRVCCHEGGYD